MKPSRFVLRARARNPLTALIAGLLAFATVQAVADDVYRWVDGEGVVNYTQRKPPLGTDVETITTATGGARVVESDAAAPPRAHPEAEHQALNPEQQKMLADLQAAERARQAEIARIKEDNCQQSRDILARLTVKDRIRVKDANGEFRVMGEDERQERIQEAQQNIVLYCVPA